MPHPLAEWDSLRLQLLDRYIDVERIPVFVKQQDNHLNNTALCSECTIENFLTCWNI